MKATIQSIQSQLEDINSRVEGILASVDQWTPSLCQELSSKWKEVLHEELNTKIDKMQLDLQAVTSLDIWTQSICKEFNRQIHRALYYIQEVKCWEKSCLWVTKDRCGTEGLL
jgi:uncharacterized protein YoxC